MLKLKSITLMGIDLAANPKNPTGIALLKNKKLKTSLVFANSEIMHIIVTYKPLLLAIDAPFSLPKTGIYRKADREMIKRGYHVFPPGFPSMRTLTLRAIELVNTLAKKGFKVIEVHPTSTRKALEMPLKNWREIEKIFLNLGLEKESEKRIFTPHEIDAVTAALTAYLYLNNQTELIGNEEGNIVVPTRRHWRTIKI